MKAIVIDDEDVMRHLLTDIMEEAGYEVVVADTGKKGWSALQKNPDSVVALVDWRMPEMSGLDFVKAVHKDPQFGDLRVILVTGRQDVEDMAQAFANGAHEYLTKPFTPDMVLDKLKVCGLNVQVHL